MSTSDMDMALLPLILTAAHMATHMSPVSSTLGLGVAFPSAGHVMPGSGKRKLLERPDASH